MTMACRMSVAPKCWTHPEATNHPPRTDRDGRLTATILPAVKHSLTGLPNKKGRHMAESRRNLIRDSLDLYAGVSDFGGDIVSHQVLEVIRECISALPNELAETILRILIDEDEVE